MKLIQEVPHDVVVSGMRRSGRALAVPKDLAELGLLDIAPEKVALMDKASFLIMCAALLFGAAIIQSSRYKARKANVRQEQEAFGQV